jgi:hypothetical protein
MGLVHLLLSLVLGTALAQDLVVLDLGEIPEEQRLVEELQLAMTEVKVATVKPEFGRLPLNEQLNLARVAAADIPAVAWLEVGEEKLLVQLAFLSADRADLQVVEVPKEPGAESRLALALREFLLEAPELVSAPQATEPEAPPAPPPTAEPEVQWRFRATTGAELPVAKLSGGLRVRGGLRFTGVGPGGELGFGLSYADALMTDQGRLGAKLVAHKDWLVLGLGVDLTLLNWSAEDNLDLPPSTPLAQPRLELGVSLFGPPSPVFVEFLLRGTFLRDEIVYKDRQLYNSGWVEFAIQTGFLQQIRKSPRHQ